MLKESSLKCCFYYHLRRKLTTLLKENNLRIYSEYYFPQLRYSADLAIVQIDLDSEADHLSKMVTNVVAIIELKYNCSNTEKTVEWIKRDISKIKSYIKSGIQCQYYFAVIYETECDYLTWMDKRSTNYWASGHVTELNAEYKESKIKFEVNSYNELNPDLFD